MMFTVGHKESYDQGIYEFGYEFKKLGRSKDYKGGIVFKNISDAMRCASNHAGYSVYGLETDILNTYELDGYRYLVNSCRILQLGI